MSVLVDTGSIVTPGEVLFHSTWSPESDEGDNTVQAGVGCYVCFVGQPSSSPSARGAQSALDVSPERRILSAALGIAQWDGVVVSVYPQPSHKPALGPSPVLKRRRSEEGVDTRPMESADRSIRTASVVGPRPHDVVHARITRVTRVVCIADIIAINGQWCHHSTSSALAAFRGVLRVEDIRPFRPTKEQVQPPDPTASFTAGDVIVAVVISQSDVRQYQLTTLPEECGVVQSTQRDPDGKLVALEHIPGRRDVMRHPPTNKVVSRWCPLIPMEGVSDAVSPQYCL